MTTEHRKKQQIVTAAEYNYSIEEVQKEEWNEGNVEAGKDASSAQ